MKTFAAVAFSLATTTAIAHAGHGKGWFHTHQDDLIEAAMVAVACLVAVTIVRLFWKVLSRP